ERLPLECLEQNLDPLLEHLAVGVLVEERRTKGLDLAGVVAAPDAEDDPPAGQDVGHRVILGEAQRVPHWHDVEAAADVDVPGDAGQVHALIRRFGVSTVTSGWEGCSAIQNVS